MELLGFFNVAAEKPKDTRQTQSSGPTLESVMATIDDSWSAQTNSFRRSLPVSVSSQRCATT